MNANAEDVMSASNVELAELFAQQKAAFAAGREAASLAERLDHLQRLEELLLANRQNFISAISADFNGRAPQETLAVEIFGLLDDIRFTRKHLKAWMRSRRVPGNLNTWPGRARIQYQPLGVVGVMGAFNYPLYLTLSPVIGALAAGNHVLAKPSEMTPRAGELLAQLVSKAFSPDIFAVTNGGTEHSKAFACLPFNHLVFTGSTRVGKLVMEQAAKNLTPVTLELGGRSPTIIGEDYDITKAAGTICYTKLLNAGQTCLAPDHVWVPEARREEFLQAASAAITKMYPRLVAGSDYTRIISEREHGRLSQWRDEARDKGAKLDVINPGNEECTTESRVFAPTLVWDCPEDATLVQNEIFGPILPVMTYRSLDEVIDSINAGPRPLALYYFSNDKKSTEQILSQTISGGVTINNCLLHVAQHNLPLGGVGDSGVGRYHGFDGFEAFSHKRSVFHASRFDASKYLRPPYGSLIQWLIGLMLHKRLVRERQPDRP